jgi:succinate-semialdehyde dehydrogenase/glutarate-semialdehyde dehydrogenase
MSSVSEAGSAAEMFIGGAPVTADLQRLPVKNPATQEVIATVPQGGPDQVDLAIDNAAAAFDSWWAMSAAQRGELVLEAAYVVSEHAGELAALLTAEQGKPLREARFEINRFCQTLEHYAGLSRSLRGAYVPNLDEHTHGLVVKRPLGVVAAILPQNFPASLLANKLGPALVTGNTVVAKPAETTPLTTLSIAKLLCDAAIPPGVFNVVTGDGSVVGEALAGHSEVQKVAFTGSNAVGRRIMAVASDTTKRLTLELGGSDPMIVCSDADIDAAVSAASVGRFSNCGQACLGVKRLYVAEEIADEFVEKLGSKVEKLAIGPGDADETHLGPLHTEAQRTLIEAQVDDATASGAQLLCGGHRPGGDTFDQGFFYAPTLLFEPAQSARVAVEEVLGPVLPIWRIGDLEEGVGLANRSIYGLGSSVWTHNLDAASYAAEKLEAGYTWINSSQKIYDELPSGGFGQSGFGKEQGSEVLEHYMESKSVVVRRLTHVTKEDA